MEEITEKESDRKLLIISLLASLTSALIFILFFYLRRMSYVPLTGKQSIASLALTLGVVTGTITLLFSLFYHKIHQTFTHMKNFRWRNFPALIISSIIILFLTIQFSFRGLGFMFPNMGFDLLTATLFYFFLSMIINYFILLFITELSAMLLTNMLAVVIIGGVFGAMLTNREQQWWRYNFSFLGTLEAVNKWRFNLTLILSAILMIALIDYLFVNLRRGIMGFV